MIFDKDGWLVRQKIKTIILHNENHDRLYDKVSNAIIDTLKYSPYKHVSRSKIKGDLKRIPLNESNYKGEKFKEWNVIGSGALSLIGKSIKTGKIIIIKILIPKVSKN